MRECGDCTLCCTLTFVPELDKQEGVTCEHCDKGCRIYEGRPKSCSEYKCAWLDEKLPEWMRPDLSHVMVEIYPLMVAVLIEEGYTLDTLDKRVLLEFNTFVDAGLPVIATGQFARLPRGMSPQEAKHRMITTIHEVRG